MEFDKSRVFTALNADELEIGSKVIVANTLRVLRDGVGYEIPAERLTAIQSTSYLKRFVVGKHTYAFAYLVEEPKVKAEPAQLKLTRDEMQDIVSYLTATHDSLYEMIMEGDTSICKDELAVRKFLRLAREKGFNINSGYDFDYKIRRITK